MQAATECLFRGSSLFRYEGGFSCIPHIQELLAGGGANQAWMNQYSGLDDPFFYAVIDKQGDQAVGVASLMRTNMKFGSIEVGHINFSGQMQRRPAGN